MAVSSRGQIPLIAQAQASKYLTHNQAIEQLSAISMGGILGVGTINPPLNALDGDVYIVGLSPTGDWAGQDNKVAHFLNNSWEFYPPFAGLYLFSIPDAAFYYWNATTSQWIQFASNAGGSNQNYNIEIISGDHVLQSGDLGKILFNTSPDAKIFVPDTISVGWHCKLANSLNNLIFTPVANAIITAAGRSTEGEFTLSANFGLAEIIEVAPNNWRIYGNLENQVAME